MGVSEGKLANSLTSMDRRFKMCTSIRLLPINFVQKYWMNNDIYVVHIEFIHTFMHNVSVLFVHGIFFVFIYV